jgi:serine/threonine protein kinase
MDGRAPLIIVVGIAAAIVFTHESGIIYRDLKPGNMLLGENRRARICDFGSSRNGSLTRTITEKVGTPLYKKPDLYDDAGCDGKSDVYSFALILCETTVSHRVFSLDRSRVQLSRKMISGERTDIPATVESYVAELVRAASSEDAAKRPSFKDIFQELQKREFCVSEDGFDAQAVASYVHWIGESRCPESWAQQISTRTVAATI